VSGLLDCANEKIDKFGNANGTKTLRMFADSIGRYVRRYGHASRDPFVEEFKDRKRSVINELTAGRALVF